MGVRLEPQDEYTHEVTAEENFNESMYFNVVDPSTRLGGFFRLGNRPNERRGEMTVCIYLPDGTVAFMFQRPEVTSNERFDAGGIRFEVVTPFEELTVAYDGKVVLLADPLELADPKAAFTNNPYADCEVRLTYTRVSDMFGGEPDTPHEAPGEEFAKGHYEQLVEARGTIRVGEQTFDVHGYGLRDHSWGPRYWQAPWYYRWLTGNVGDDFGFMASRIAKRDAEGTRGGFVWEDGRLHLVDHVTVATEWEGPDRYHRQVRATLSEHKGDRTWEVTGRVASLAPLRNRRHTPDGDLLVTRKYQGLNEWTQPHGPVGWGL
jgi:hypothetical protein